MRKHGQSAKLILLIWGALLLTACQHTVAGQVDHAKPVRITYWHRMTGTWAQSQQQLIDDFNQSQQKYHVVAKSWGSYTKLNKKIKQAAKKDELPVLAQTPYTNIADYVAADLLQPLDQAMYQGKSALSHKQLVDINPSFLATGQYDGKQYALPFSISTRILYYNQALLDKYQLQVPTTWDELLRTAKKARSLGLVPIAMDHSPDLELESMAFGIDQQPIDSQLHVNINSSANQQLTRMISQATQTGLIRVAPADRSFTYEFLKGNTLFGFGSSSAIPELQQQTKRLSWGTTILPQYGTSSTNVLAGNDLIIFKQASKKQQKGAWQFMRFLLKKKQVTTWAIDSGYVPVTGSAIRSKEYQALLKAEPQYGAAVKSIKTSFKSQTFVGYQLYREIMLTTITGVQAKPENLEIEQGQLQNITENIITSHQQADH
ncbi:extracellular solute-binding protein [Lapidilactobacillus luobeiensis]|uniref:extracellular solute-binding protein n=1 Tax=Lapidilactobacillus luobeiensis TaxID=2950371 RepID=UPI0021C299AA|nr:extracellular solute-binding protein [Lapidilactobacillus luobeiensis]